MEKIKIKINKDRKEPYEIIAEARKAGKNVDFDVLKNGEYYITGYIRDGRFKGWESKIL